MKKRKIASRIMDIHDRIDIERARIDHGEDKYGNEIVHTSEEKLDMYVKLVDRIHDVVFNLAGMVEDGKLPPPIWGKISVSKDIDINEIKFHPKWDHHNK